MLRQSVTSDHSVQPPLPSLPGPHQRHRRSHQSHHVLPPVPSAAGGSGAMSTTSTSPSAGGTGANNNNNNKRSSPLNYFSLDIPASLAGASGSTATSPALPHQSCSLPFVARLVRTPSTSSAGRGSAEPFEHGPLQPPQQVRHFDFKACRLYANEARVLHYAIATRSRCHGVDIDT